MLIRFDAGSPPSRERWAPGVARGLTTGTTSTSTTCLVADHGLMKIEFLYTLISNAPDIVGTAFGGSPTIALEGVDLFPGEPAAELSCRMYPTPDGPAGPTQTAGFSLEPCRLEPG